MLIAGLLTCTMLFAVISPELAMRQFFGEALQGSLANMIVRSWGALITLVGVMLIFAAFKPLHRKLVATIAAISKLIYVGLVLSLDTPYLEKAAVAVGFDALVALLLLSFVFMDNKRA